MPSKFETRFWEILPGVLAWATLLGAPILAYFHPVWIALYIIVFDVYWFLKGGNVAVHLVHSYNELKTHDQISWMDWLKRLVSRQDFEKYLETQITQETNPRLQKLYVMELKKLRALPADRNFDYNRIYHVVILTAVRESLQVLEPSVASCATADYDPKKIIFILATEERAAETGEANGRALAAKFGNTFGKFLVTKHPDAMPGEAKVKGANLTWAAKKAAEYLTEQGIRFENVILSAFDSDSVVAPNYFSHLTYDFLTAEKPLQCSYQPMPLYHNNIWDTPAAARVIAISSSFWQLIEASRPDRLVTFSSHAMSFKTLVDVGYWRVDIIPDDSHIFWQGFMYYHGDYKSLPLFTTISMDAVLGSTYIGTFVAQYKQKRRWAWGVSEIPMLFPIMFRDPKIPFWKKFLYAERLLEGHYFWATASIMIAILGWLPLIFGGSRFGASVLAVNLLPLTKWIMTIATFFLIFSVYINWVMLPKRPQRYTWWKSLSMIWQWIFSPVVASVFGSLPAIDAQTRLMIGKRMETFYVTPKFRKENSAPTSTPEIIKT